MTDIIKFNEEHTPKTEIGKMKFQLAEALNTIADLQNGYKFPKLTATERHEKFNKAMMTVCDILGIDLDMHEMMKTGAEGFSYSNTEDDTKTLEQLLSNNRSHDIKTKLFTLFTLASGLSHSDTDFIAIDDKGAEKPATQKELAKALRTNLVELTESLGLSLDQVTESHTEQAQDTVKTIVSNLQEIAERPYEHSNGDIDTLGDLVYSYVSDLRKVLGIELPVQEATKDEQTEDMLNKLHEVQDHILNSGQNAVSMNQVQTAISILEGSLGVMGKVEE